MINKINTPNMKLGTKPDYLNFSFDKKFLEIPMVWVTFIGYNIVNGNFLSIKK
jgi:hypothetical protein